MKNQNGTGEIFDFAKKAKKERENLQSGPKVTFDVSFFNPRGVGYYFIWYIYKREVHL